MNSFKIGFTSTTFKEKTIEEIIEIAQKSDARFIEWGENCHINSLADARKANMLCEKAGIKISSYGSYYHVGSNNAEKWEKICKIAAEMNADSVRIWLGSKDSELTSEEEYGLLLSENASMCETAEKYGLTVAAECHDNTFNNNTDSILKFTKDLKKTNFKTYFQSRYFRFEYDIDRIERTYDITKDIHVSYSEVTREQLFRKKDKDYLDAILRKFKEKNFEGIVMLEFTEDSSETAFLRDIDNLKKY